MNRYIVITCCTLFALTILSCGESHEKKTTRLEQEQKERDARQARIDQAIQQVADHWNAYWFDLRKLKKKPNPIFTYYLKDLLVRGDGTPILFVADEVLDINRNKDNFTVRFRLRISGLRQIYFTLSCPPEETQKIINSTVTTKFKDNYVVVGQISLVSVDNVGREGSSNLHKHIVALGKCMYIQPMESINSLINSKLSKP